MISISNIKFKQLLPFALVLLFGIFLLTFKTLRTPPGIETDEGSIVYNSILISRTLHDQNGRLLPFFFLSSDHIDWKQPVLIYLSAIFLKVFGANLYVFKMVNVVTSLIAMLIFAYILQLLFKNKTLTLAGMLFYLTTPIIIITSRIGNESAQPLLYTTLWLLFITLFRRTNRALYLGLAAFSLGIDFYCFKGMRIIVPVYISLTFLYVFWHYFIREPAFKALSQKKASLADGFKLIFTAVFRALLRRQFLIRIFTFIAVLLPFFLIIPFLEAHYPGAVFDRHLVHFEPFRYYVYYWLQNLSFSFLYTHPDIGRIYSVEIFGGLLLGALPFFLLGVKSAISRFDFKFFILLCYLFTPVFFGFAESIDYTHRLMAMMPFYLVIVVLGFKTFLEYFMKAYNSSGLSRLTAVTLAAVFAVFTVYHFAGFASYYYFKYPFENEVRSAFGNDLNHIFTRLAKVTREQQLDPYVQNDIYDNHGDGNKFYNIAYFDGAIKSWSLGGTLPSGSVLLTQNNHIDGMDNVPIDVSPYFILVKN